MERSGRRPEDTGTGLGTRRLFDSKRSAKILFENLQKSSQELREEQAAVARMALASEDVREPWGYLTVMNWSAELNKCERTVAGWNIAEREFELATYEEESSKEGHNEAYALMRRVRRCDKEVEVVRERVRGNGVEKEAHRPGAKVEISRGGGSELYRALYPHIVYGEVIPAPEVGPQLSGEEPRRMVRLAPIEAADQVTNYSVAASPLKAKGFAKRKFELNGMSLRTVERRRVDAVRALYEVWAREFCAGRAAYSGLVEMGMKVCESESAMYNGDWRGIHALENLWKWAVEFEAWQGDHYKDGRIGLQDYLEATFARLVAESQWARAVGNERR
jgi:hypothetical protein